MPRRKADTDAIMGQIELRIANSDLLSDEEKEQTRVRAKAHVDELRKKNALDAYFNAMVSQENARWDPNEELLDITIELGEYSPCITINGMNSYYHGVTYTVPRSLHAVLMDISWQTQQHQREIDGKKRRGDLLRKAANLRISPSDPNGRVSSTGNMRM